MREKNTPSHSQFVWVEKLMIGSARHDHVAIDSVQLRPKTFTTSGSERIGTIETLVAEGEGKTVR